jgi:hypothetical protein
MAGGRMVDGFRVKRRQGVVKIIEPTVKKCFKTNKLVTGIGEGRLGVVNYLSLAPPQPNAQTLRPFLGF